MTTNLKVVSPINVPSLVPSAVIPPSRSARTARWSPQHTATSVIPSSGNVSYSTLEDYKLPRQDEEFKTLFYEAIVKEKTILFLVSEEAPQNDLIKVLWLDINRACVWDKRLRPSQMLSFKGQIFGSGGSLAAF
ncbi:hypothetical protein FHL15_005469 [Xylaria flabelliformis]|uniref:Uncharacterized protein n=1 Tax=Xylaria flabelliformis TaxID=2512241 RepID=A0A553HZW3_9PEZI|nr:hypothetical protein FHL15_005469 [Xylaria flabelliformis]